MKKVLTTALILGAFYGIANAIEITSPIYMPKKGEIINNLSFGKSRGIYDNNKYNTSTTLMQKSSYISDFGKIGLNDKLSLNYGFTFNFNENNRELLVLEMSKDGYKKTNKFYDRYFGLTARAYDNDKNKLDVVLNFGQTPTMLILENTYADLSAKYGLDLNNYNLTFSFGGIYYASDKIIINGSGVKYEEKFQYYFKLENEITFADNFTFDLNLKYHKDRGFRLKYAKGKTTNNIMKIKGSDNYSIYAGLNYSLNKLNYIGIYFENTWSHGQKEYILDSTTYDFGIKLTSKF